MAYQPCSSQGPSTAWMQQWVLLRESGIKNPNPIQTFYHDLEEQLLQWISKGYAIILMIDTNENVGDKPGGITTIIGKTGLQDLVRCRHPNQHEPKAPHSRGSTRIDYIFGTRKISDHCKKARILPFNILGYMSDHRAIFVEIDIEAVLSTNVRTIESITVRKLQQATP
jgi:endonuclease/exonuclease/phosphatase family metal-dependent hydrolase